MKIIYAVFAAFIVLPVAHAESVCRAKKDGVAYKLSIDESNSIISKFSYQSITTDVAEYTCEIFRDRNGKDNSRWENPDQNMNLTRITRPGAEGEANSTVEITKIRNGYRLRMLEPRDHATECGLNGYLAPSIVLRKNSKWCKVED